MTRRWFRGRAPAGDGDARRSPTLVILAVLLSLATIALVSLAWLANVEMRRSTTLLLERRAGEVLALTSAALNRDMKGAWLSVLTPLEPADLREDPPYDLLQLTSRAFAHFPYPESFIVWLDDGGPAGRTYVFTRTDRPAPWDPADHRGDPYPVALVADPAPLAPVVERIRQRAHDGRRFSLLETTIAGAPYHVVTHRFISPTDARLTGFAAFTVNLDWVRREYFGELLRQVSTIDGDADAMAIAVLDETGAVVATSGTTGAAAPVRQRTFPLLFVEPALVVPPPPADSPVRYWVAQVQPSEAVVRAASQLGTQTLLIASLASAASLAALLLTVRAVRARAELAAMKSEFVSAVTHELKTPLALIKLVGDTLARGRYSSPETVRDYAAMLVQEERRLSHLIENLLTYSRLADMRALYSPEPVDVLDVVEDALQPFQLRLQELQFALTVDIDPGLPRVTVDRAAMVQAVINLIDNAIKYSPHAPRRLDIAGRAEGSDVHLRFSDGGIGIAEEELPRVLEKFYRGRESRESGSGLGLTIVQRIVQQHGGRLTLTSVVGRGTTITLTLPAAS